ncbi:LytR/AlgR family response regulator transcription factor [Planctobacterium marinum]|uniref:LytR/AlgR family response regulator transcription factor n=1 Tax=Planctobacterium marinum TaxID=1631968 RepID=UPI001E4EE912|nr:response regulator transcription factor [Planctobacterium marinum]MCC2603799.1 response regulator transcription factor [Planctobacterium marinum]
MQKACLKVLIADDELLARQGLMSRLSGFSQLEILPLCENGNDALNSIRQHRPDAVFLDIEMPGLTGIDLLNKLLQEKVQLPYVVFTTAHQNFALDAFNFESCDYLLKPVDVERLTICIQRIEKTIEQQKAFALQEKLQQLLTRKTGKTLDGFIENLENEHHCHLNDLQNYISFKSGTEWIKVALQDIDWIEAVGDYMCLHINGKQQIIRKTMKQLESELDSAHFPRVSRSAMVNATKICKLSPNSNGEYYAHLSCQTVVKVTRKYKYKLEEIRRKNAPCH